MSEGYLARKEYDKAEVYIFKGFNIDQNILAKFIEICIKLCINLSEVYRE